MRLEEMMTRRFATLKPGDTLKSAIRLLRNSQRDGVPVLKENGTLAGIFTKTNLYDAMLKNSSLEESISEHYNRNAVKISKELSYDEVIDAVRRIPVGTGVVVDNGDRVVGLFTKVELITALFKEERLLNTRLSVMYQAMHNAIISIDENNRVNFINRSAELLFNIKREEIEGLNINTVLPELAMQKVLSSGLIEIGVNYSYKEVMTIVNKTPLLDGGRVVGAIAIFQDITELENIAEEIGLVKRLNQTLKTVLDIGYDALVVVDEKGTILLANRPFLDFTRLTEEKVLSRPINEILENSRLHVVVKTGIPEINDIQFIDGKPYVASRLPIVREGQVIGAVGKISFRRVDELRDLATRLEMMNSRLTHFQEELKKARYREKPFQFEDIITINPEMQEVIREARQAATGLSNVLVSGESGVGKELMAQAIHQASPRSREPFIKVNCAAIPENLLESEFFGYDQGAFTGARRGGKSGRLDSAHGGTLFLDEIGDMPLLLQGKLLRVLQDQKFERVGGMETIQVDIRFIAATNQDLEKKVQEGSFRNDLFFRLNVIPIPIPPLRKRKEDIMPLAYAFLKKYNQIFGMQVIDVSPDAIDAMRSYSWPGNVRELENVIERAMNFTSESIITLEHLPSQLRLDSPGRIDSSKASTKSDPFSEYQVQLEDKEREIFLKALKKTNGNKSEAARILGISRSWLYRKIKQLELS